MPTRQYDKSETVKIGQFRYYLYRVKYTDRWFGKVVQVFQEDGGRWKVVEIIPEPPEHISFDSQLAVFQRLLELWDPWS